MASTISHCRLSVAEHSYRARRASERADRISRARRNLAQAAAAEHPITDTPTPQRDREGRAFGTALIVVVGSQLVLAYSGFCSASAPSHHADVPRKIQVVMAQLQKPVPEPLPVEAPKPPTAPPVVAERPRPPPTSEPRPRVEEATPTPAPVAAPVPIVGLTFESTSSSAGGPVFAVGDTLSGTTQRVAEEVRPAQSVSPAESAPVQPRVSRNQVAAPRAAAGVTVEPARRLSRVEPVYPALLGRQNLEADVTVRVRISKDRTLLSAEIVRGAQQVEFNQAALTAAKQERFQPETHDGVSVETSLTYTYRFRITP